ncbi:MAG TPA: TraM recognition domain-containing protein [Candidatus Saccharimonadia bacterium]|nr:TraM recognition domain-containing protein [Candidatus Saccharimonadia bacterium]
MTQHLATELAFVRFWLPPTPAASDQAAATAYESTRLFMTALAGLLASRPRSTISLEIAAKDGAVAYILAIPSDWEPEVLHHLYAAYPGGWGEHLDEWNLFEAPGELAAAKVMATPAEAPLRSDKFDIDPLQPLVELLCNLPPTQQLVVQLALTASRRPGLLAQLAGDVGQGLTDELRHLVMGRPSKPDDAKTKPAPTSEPEPNKAETAPLQANLRLLALAPTAAEAGQLVRRALGTLHQLTQPGQSKWALQQPRQLQAWLPRPLQRQFEPAAAFWLTIDEAANLYHPPARARDQPALAQLAARQLPPPTSPSAGLLLGHSLYRGQSQPVRLAAADRLRHLYLIGQTGTGKSTLFQSAMLQDVEAGEGCCFIDPHGEAIDWLLPRIPAHRAADVVLFDPSDDAALLGLNLLEWRTPHERDLLIQELVLLFYKLFDPGHTGIIGPQFEHWLRSAALTITEPNVRGALTDIPRLFTDAGYSKAVVARAEHQAVKDFWHGQMAQTATFHKSEMLNYFTSKFGTFMGNAVMHRILSQRSSAFNMRELMDRRKILLVNLSKGKLGTQNAAMLGTLLMAKLQMAALSRADVAAEHRAPFYVYIDEFQNVATDSFAEMLSEIRKYGVGLHLAHQYGDQLPEKLRQAVAGNVGTMLAFRLGRTDADWLAPHFAPLTSDDLTAAPPYQYHLRPLVNGQLATPFTVRTEPPAAPAQPRIEQAIRARVRSYVAAVG